MAAIPVSEILTRWSAEMAFTFAASSQNAFALRHGKNVLLAEDVAENRQFFFRDPGNHFVHQQIHVFLAFVLVFIGNLVGAQEGGNNSQRQKRGQLFDDPQAFDLILDGEPVTALGFDGGSTVFDKFPHPVVGQFGDFIERGFAENPHAVADAAPGSGNFFVRFPGNAHFEFFFPGFVEHRVSMRIHKTGHRPAIFAVDEFGAGIFLDKLFRAVNRGNLFIIKSNSDIVLNG